MRSLLTLALGLVASSALGGCATNRIPFTHEIRSQYRLTDEEVRNLQFYVSDSITLRRELTAKDRQVTGAHVLALTSGKMIEEVVVEKSTPGVAVALSRDTISVSFDVGSQLDFSLRAGETTSPPPAAGAPYAQPPDPFPASSGHPPEPPPETSDLFGKFFLRLQPNGAFVAFQGQTFDAVGDSYKAHLLIDANTLDEVVENHTVLPGRKLGAANVPASPRSASAAGHVSPWIAL